ncbi:MAG: cell division protein FtsL [Myxococcales bacterium]
MKSHMKSQFLALWTVAVLSTGAAFVAYLALRFETVRLGYALDKENQENKRLSEVRRMLALEVQTLRERQRVAVIAERTLGMATPDKTRIVSVEGAALSRTSAGRTR